MPSNRSRYAWRRFRPQLLCVVLVLLPTLLCAEPVLRDIEYAVIGASLRHGLGDASASLVIDARTTGDPVNIADRERELIVVAAELETTPRALQEWSRLNRERYQLGQIKGLDEHYEFMAEADRMAIFGGSDPNENWQNFRRRYANAPGIVRVSRPGIDEATNTATIYLEFECGPKCGSGRLINLDRSASGDWRVTHGTLVWITSP